MKNQLFFASLLAASAFTLSAKAAPVLDPDSPSDFFVQAVRYGDTEAIMVNRNPGSPWTMIMKDLEEAAVMAGAETPSQVKVFVATARQGKLMTKLDLLRSLKFE